MLNLLRKDFIAMKSSLWTIMIYLAVFSFTFIPTSEMSIYFVGIYTAFGAIILTTMIDIKNHNHQFLITLPINRKQIVQAKYITTILYTILAVVASYGIHWFAKLAFPQFDKSDYSLSVIMISIGIVLVLIAVYMPLFYTFSKKGAGIINAVFLIILITLAQPAAKLISVMEQQDVSSQTWLLVPAGVLLLFITSYFLTITLFNRKDL